jgi:hypothetical protein
MRLFGRAPGAVYRVYGEDEYLEGETQPAGHHREDPRSSLRPAALIGATLLFVVAAIAAVLVMSATTHHAAHSVAAGAKTSRLVPPQRSRRRSTPHPAQLPRASRPTPKRALVRVVRSDAHSGVRVSAPEAVAPAAAAFRPAGSESEDALSEFGFER